MKIQGNHHTGRVTNTGPVEPPPAKTEKEMTKSPMNISEEVYCLLFKKDSLIVSEICIRNLPS